MRREETTKASLIRVPAVQVVVAGWQRGKSELAKDSVMLLKISIYH